MEMLLTVLAMSMLGVAVSAMLFAAATRETPAAIEAPADVRRGSPSEFFTEGRQVLVSPPVSVDVLLLQIEGHVRMEQAAVEAFLAMPTAENLHTPTRSPLVH